VPPDLVYFFTQSRLLRTLHTYLKTKHDEEGCHHCPYHPRRDRHMLIKYPPLPLLLLILSINLLQNSGLILPLGARRPQAISNPMGMERAPPFHANMMLGWPRCAYATCVCDFILWATTLLSTLALRTCGSFIPLILPRSLSS
jgi:hypothetical protein